MLIKKIQSDESMDEPGALPAGLACVGASLGGGLLFESSLDKLPEGFVAAVIDDVVGVNRFKLGKADINSARDRGINNGVEIEGVGRIDTDQKSLQRIAGAGILAMLPIVSELFTIEHKRASIANDADTLKALGDAHGAFKTDWIDADNNTFEMGFNELLKIIPALAEHERNHVFEAYGLKAGLALKVFGEHAANESADEGANT